MLGGNPTSAPATSLLYAGEHFNPDVSGYYNRARYYDQNTGRFNRMDPFAGNYQDPQSLHKYLYAYDNPVNNVDPSGEIGIGFTIAIVTVGIILTSVAVFWGISHHRDTQTVNKAIDNAKTLVRDAIMKLMRWNMGERSEYKKWFGALIAANRTYVRNGFIAIQNALFGKITWEKSNNPYYASVVPGGPVHIELARLFWKAPALGVNSQAGVFIHELSHEAWNTNDWAYGTFNCKALAISNSSLAIDNADNYEYFAEVAP